MALVLNGTDGSVSAPAVTGSTGGTGTGIYYPASNQVAISTNGTQTLLASSGYITMPNQVGFFISSYTPTSVGANYFKVSGPTTNWSVGGGLNLTGGPSGATRYTAPTTGYYYYQWALMGSGTTGRMIAFTEKNTAVVTENNSDSVNYANSNTQFVIYLVAGDYLDFRTSGTYYAGANAAHYMSIRLIG
jgi:hypothetical protein